MKRNKVTKAIVISTFPIGEIHRGTLLLTPDLGVISAIAHGAMKSKGQMRNLTSLFSSITVHLYHDTVRDSWKITDAEEIRLHESLRESLERYYAASLWAEIISKTREEASDSSGLFTLLSNSLGLLETSVGNQAELLSIQFLNRFLSIVGLAPEFISCVRCGSQRFGNPRFSTQEMGMVCDACARGDERPILLGTARYLASTISMNLEEAYKIGLAKESLRQAKDLLIDLISRHLEARLNSIKDNLREPRKTRWF